MLLLRGEHFSRPCQTAPTFHILSRWSLSPPVQSCLCSAHEQSRVVLGNFSPRTEKVMASWSTGPAQECDVVMQGTGSERRWHLEGSLCRAFSSAACRPWRQGCCFLGSWVIHLSFCCIHHTDSSLRSPWMVNESPLLPCNVNLNTSCCCLTVKAFQRCSIRSAQVTAAPGKSAYIVFFFSSIISFVVI